MFRNIVFADDIHAEIMVSNFENWLMTSDVFYVDFPTENKLELIASPSISQLSDVMSRSIIEPTFIASPEDFRELNEVILQQQAWSQ